MDENKIDVSTLDDDKLVNYAKSIFFNNDVSTAVSTLLKEEGQDLKISKVILNVLNDDLIVDKIKKDNNLSNSKSVKLFVCSKILWSLCFYNKDDVLKNFLKILSKEELKKIAYYEYQNKTDVSLSSSIFNKYASKYKNDALASLLDETETLTINDEKEKSDASSKKKSKKKTFVIVFILLVILIVLGLVGYKFYGYSKLISKYNNKIYPGIYLNDIDLSGTKISDLKNIISDEEKRIKNESITIKSPNTEVKFSLDEIGAKVITNNLKDKITNYNKDLSFFKKVDMLQNKKKQKSFYLEATYDDSVIDNFIKTLEEKLNTTARNDGIVVDENHNLSYDKGSIGFDLDASKTKDKIVKALLNLKDNEIIEAEGTIVKNEVKYSNLASINKKVSSYTTYFMNSGNRGHNISLASRRLNNTVIMPGEVFSYLKVVGPYGSSNGYLPAPIYLNSEVATANGGGVCQLASTLYMAQLKAGLETVARRNHTFAPNYVPKGLDATVYSTTTDYKFKNNYDYPIYITSYVSGNYLTVDIWTNDAALGGKTFEPYSVYSNGAYLSYLKTIENGMVTNIKYLGKSVYKTMQ